MRFHSVRNKMMVSTFLLILVCALIVIYICSQQMETHFFQYLQDPSALAGQQGAGGYGRGMGRGMMGGGMGMGGMHHRMMLGAAERTFVESYHQSLWWIGFLFAGVGLVVSYFLSGNITRPLRQLSQAAEKIRQGDLKQEVPVDTQDEVGQLAEVFNQMSAELAANESNRQELLANIAHELKTPLAVLQGHLESMLDGVEEPAPDKLFSMQEEVMRLTRLVGDLRDLSLAQVHRLELHLQPVDLDESGTGGGHAGTSAGRKKAPVRKGTGTRSAGTAAGSGPAEPDSVQPDHQRHPVHPSGDPHPAENGTGRRPGAADHCR